MSEFTPRWIINIDTNCLIYDTGQLGAFFRGSEWQDATQAQIDAWTLADAKNKKVADLKSARDAWIGAGFDYGGDLFQVDFQTLGDIVSKNLIPVDDPDRYKFYDNPPEASQIPRKQIDFVDAAGWSAFVLALSVEYDRIMKKYNAYREQIDQCSTVAEVEAIIIDFSEL